MPLFCLERRERWNSARLTTYRRQNWYDDDDGKMIDSSKLFPNLPSGIKNEKYMIDRVVDLILQSIL